MLRLHNLPFTIINSSRPLFSKLWYILFCVPYSDVSYGLFLINSQFTQLLQLPFSFCLLILHSVNCIFLVFIVFILLLQSTQSCLCLNYFFLLFLFSSLPFHQHSSFLPCLFQIGPYASGVVYFTTHIYYIRIVLFLIFSIFLLLFLSFSHLFCAHSFRAIMLPSVMQRSTITIFQFFFHLSGFP